MSLAFVFPGQGSQSNGMMANLAEDSLNVQKTFTQASDVLGYDLWNLVQNDDSGRLNQTEVTQPAMLAAGVAAYHVWCERSDTRPSVMAGHSLGEYTALVCAGALPFEDAIRLVELRGQLMQEAVPAGVGAMAAILGLTDEQVIEICQNAAEGEVAQAVNFNSPGQVVIAGNKDAIERAMVLAKDAGAKRALPLPVSVPSHCDLMKPAAEKLKIELEKVDVSMPSIPVIHNYNVALPSSTDGIKEALTAQLFQPVRWVETIQKMHNDGIQNVVEMGPGKVLMGLNKRIEKSMQAMAVFDTASLQKTLDELEG